MVIYLKHPVHGTKVACMEMEAVFDESNGWERYDLVSAPASEPADAVNALASETLTVSRRRRVEAA